MWAVRRAGGRVMPCARRACTVGSSSSSRSRYNATLAAALHAQDPGRPALLAPAQKMQWSYGELSTCVARLSGGLAAMGYGAGDVIATDLASVAENLILQLAVSHLGAAVLTCKSAKDLETLGHTLTVRGVVASRSTSFLANAALPIAPLFVEPSGDERLLKQVYETDHDASAPAEDSSAALGYYATAKPITNANAMAEGAACKEQLAMTEQDVVLVSITLNHLFGIGCAVSAALQSGAAIVLPDASGIVGCGSPSQRAAATLFFLDDLGCTLLYADTHTYKALTALEPPKRKALRGGICKVGSGTTFLEPKLDLAGVSLSTMGKAA